ncbi:hypothetical protein HAX54_049541, partial [Datura stramonium]|nr:hypothetical protein [Datura stramonium]
MEEKLRKKKKESSSPTPTPFFASSFIVIDYCDPYTLVKITTRSLLGLAKHDAFPIVFRLYTSGSHHVFHRQQPLISPLRLLVRGGPVCSFRRSSNLDLSFRTILAVIISSLK